MKTALIAFLLPSSLSYLVGAKNTVQSSEHGYCIQARVREHKWGETREKEPYWEGWWRSVKNTRKLLMEFRLRWSKLAYGANYMIRFGGPDMFHIYVGYGRGIFLEINSGRKNSFSINILRILYNDLFYIRTSNIKKIVNSYLGQQRKNLF
ncbi:hypothetical protein TNCV_4183691 [Trichonephila clavipes]|nr:hypothetical protein TNCV_4183691 [Trichonephila clavipes]